MEIEFALSRASEPQYPFTCNGVLYWLEALPEQGGRVSVMSKTANDRAQPITPPEFNIRTRVNEYGGKCFCQCGRGLVFNNYQDNSLYYQDLESGALPVRLLDANDNGQCVGFADLVCIPGQEWIIAVMETSHADRENSSSIVAVKSGLGGPAGCGSQLPVILESGSDFYACPVVSPDGSNLAWLEWSHPHMPWDQTRLCRGELSCAHGLIALCNSEILVNEDSCAVCQPGFTEDGKLVFASDNSRCDFWNLFSFENGDLIQITDEKYELGEAHWIFGQCRWLDDSLGGILAIATQQRGDCLVRVDLASGECRVVGEVFASLCQLSRGCALSCNLVAHHADRPPEIVSISIRDNTGYLEKPKQSPGHRGHSDPVFVEFDTTNNEVAYAYYYPPFSSTTCAIEGTLPPVVVMVHGGPTARSTREYAGLKQYYCSMGYAVLDINHRGSTGFGREFRQSLAGQWGEYDCKDIKAGIDFVVKKRWVDPRLVFIRGSSAGGYAVLRALTRYPGLFSGGASYYGIGNLITLSEITHKFESRYTDQLLGECFDAIKSRRDNSRYVKRSPLFDMDKIQCPIILFQGAEDQIVPPGIAYEIVDLLKQNGIHHSYTEYPDEGHGFRKAETRIDAMERESAFFAEIIRDEYSSLTISPGNKIDRAET